MNDVARSYYLRRCVECLAVQGWYIECQHAMALALIERGEDEFMVSALRQRANRIYHRVKSEELGFGYDVIESQSLRGLLTRMRGMTRRFSCPALVEIASGGVALTYRLTPWGLDVLRALCDTYQSGSSLDTEAATGLSRRSLVASNKYPDARSKLFIEGKAQAINCLESPEQVAEQFAQAEYGPVTVTVHEPNGEPVMVPNKRVISWRGVNSTIDTVSSFLMGKRYAFKGLTRDEATELDLESAPEFLASCVHVLAEDLVEALVEASVCVIHAERGVVWRNPAEPDEAIDRFARIVRLLAEADALYMAANEPEHRGDDERAFDPTRDEFPIKARRDAAGFTEDQTNALAWLDQRGNVQAAISIAGREFVTAYLAELSFSQTVVVLCEDGRVGEITGYDNASETFELMHDTPRTRARASLGDIKRIVSVDGQALEA